MEAGYGWDRWKRKLERIKKFLHKIHHIDLANRNTLLSWFQNELLNLQTLKQIENIMV